MINSIINFSNTVGRSDSSKVLFSYSVSLGTTANMNIVYSVDDGEQSKMNFHNDITGVLGLTDSILNMFYSVNKGSGEGIAIVRKKDGD